MRRALVAASLVLAHTGLALGQNRVEQSAPTNDGAVGLDGPLESPGTRDAPPSKDRDATYEVSLTPVAPAPKLKPASADTDLMSRRVSLGVLAGYGSPYGNFASSRPMGVRLGGLYSVGLDVTYGFSRNLQVALLGDWGRVVGGPQCDDCKATTISLGPRLRFHLVEGTRFSPWLSYGVALRRTVFESADKQTFTALEPIRVEFGGDWYATSVITIGPVLSLGVSRTIDAPDSLHGRWSSWLSAGLRLGFDPSGR